MNNPTSLSYEVSNTDLEQKIPYPFKLIVYPEMANYSDITQLLTKSFSLLVILYEAGNNANHWVMMCRKGNY